MRRVGGLNTLLAKVTGTPHAELDTRDTPEDHKEDMDRIGAQLTEERLQGVPTRVRPIQLARTPRLPR
jgi:hypothetical protein